MRLSTARPRLLLLLLLLLLPPPNRQGPRPADGTTRHRAGARRRRRVARAASPDGVSTHVSFEPPPWLEFTTRLPSGNATRVSPPGATQTRFPSFTANGRRSTCRGANPSPVWVGEVESCTTSWAIHPRGFSSTWRRSLLDLLVGRRGTDHDAVATGPVDRLDHELVEPIQDVGPLVGIAQVEGVDVGEDRLLVEVVPDQVGDVAVQRLVVGDTVADRVGDGDVARAGRVHDPGAAQHRIRAELERVEEVVVDPSVDDVHALPAGGAAHEDHAVTADEVAALHEGDPHLPRQERVLEVRRRCARPASAPPPWDPLGRPAPPPAAPRGGAPGSRRPVGLAGWRTAPGTRGSSPGGSR